MKSRMTAKLALLAALCFSFTACQPTFQCGTWDFSGAPSGNAFPLNDTFTFNPSGCGQSCEGSQDVIIQMTWVYDEDMQTNVYASDQPQGSRSTPNGWCIDRVDGAAHGYYGLQNNGTFYSGWNTPGGPGTGTTLKDKPGGWGANTVFYAVDVAVCYNSRTCNNKILGYYFWSYILDNSDVGQKFVTAPAWKDLDTEFQAALTAWNNWAPLSGTESDGTGTETHAIAFPSMSDL